MAARVVLLDETTGEDAHFMTVFPWWHNGINAAAPRKAPPSSYYFVETDYGSRHGTQVNTCFVNALCGQIEKETGAAVGDELRGWLLEQLRPMESADFLTPLDESRAGEVALQAPVRAICEMFAVDLVVYVGTALDRAPYTTFRVSGASAVVTLQLRDWEHWVGLSLHSTAADRRLAEQLARSQ